MKILQIIARLQTKITYQSMHTSKIHPKTISLMLIILGVTILLANITANYF